jgi:glycosyltransferase involved in cell wall biosynthesis
MPEVCLIVPCFNEERRLDAGGFLRFVDARAGRTLCLVNDGSRDGTGRVLADLQARAPGKVLVLAFERNAGKAEAVRRGVVHALSKGKPDFVGYWDADLSTPLEEVDAMLSVMAAHPGCRMVLGSRWKRLGSRIDRRAVRHVLGRVFATFASLTLSLPVYDSQCGAKLFRADAAARLFAEPFVTRWLFDVELLARLTNEVGVDAMLGGAAVEHALTSWREVSGSTLGPAHMAAVPRDLWRIRQRYGSGR